MTINQINTPDDESIYNWLMDIPQYKESHDNTDELLEFVHISNSTFKQRKERCLSISSDDSINLDALINENYTTDLNNETDLTALASIELDDSNEDFWKLDHVIHHFTPPKNLKETSKTQDINQDNSCFNGLSLSKLDINDKEYNLTNKFISATPKNIAGQCKVLGRSASSSTISSQATIYSQHSDSDSLSTSPVSTAYSRSPTNNSLSSFSRFHIYSPTKSSSTSTTSTCVSPSKKYSMKKFSTDNTETVTQFDLTKKSLQVPYKISTSFTSINAPHQNNYTNALTRSKSKIGISHIPTPIVRSNTSLGISTYLFSPSQHYQSNLHSRPNTSMSANKVTTQISKPILPTPMPKKLLKPSRSTGLIMLDNISQSK